MTKLPALLIPLDEPLPRLDWHALRFEWDDRKVRVECFECGIPMWLPPSKIAEYRRCGPKCQKVWRDREREKRRRECATCGKVFYPRSVQINDGQGRYCSTKCAPRGHLTTPEALSKAQEAHRQAILAGRHVYPRGAEHHSWKGGKEALWKRDVASGKLAAQVRSYRQRNPEKVREWSQRRSSGKTGRLPRGTVARIGEAQRWKCAICRKGIKRHYHVDHVTPIALGGKHEARNIQLLCESCNVRKNAKDPIIYMQSLGRLL